MVAEPGLFRVPDLVHLRRQRFAGLGELGVVQGHQAHESLLIVFTVQAEDAVGPQHAGGRVVVGQDQHRIEEADVIELVVFVVLGKDIEHQVTHLVEVQVPVVEPGILKVLMGHPGGADVILLLRIGAPGHAEDLCRQGDPKLLLPDDLPTQLLFAGALREVLREIRVLRRGVVLSTGHQRAGAQIGHQAGQRLLGRLVEGLEFQMAQLLQVLPAVGQDRLLILRVKGLELRSLELHQVEGVFLPEPAPVAQHDGPPVLMMRDTLRQTGHGICQGALLGPPLAELDMAVIEKGL